ncbi:MAG: hypothetical protein EBZ61_08815 [Micrococcales bacterium]|jgi:hypothetical protein|nr:hypothetical protein [Micrococcales bacterium]
MKVFMSNFIQKQIESSERLYKMMLTDHKERVEKLMEAYALSASLQKKLEERDEEIAKLRRQLQAYEALERM